MSITVECETQRKVYRSEKNKNKERHRDIKKRQIKGRRGRRKDGGIALEEDRKRRGGGKGKEGMDNKEKG